MQDRPSHRGAQTLRHCRRDWRWPQEQVAIAPDMQLVVDVDTQRDVLVLGDWLINIADLAQDLVQRDVTETGRASTVLDFREAQQRGDDRERLIDPSNGLVRDLLKLLQRCCMRPPPLQD
jgi:hypothetical protein